LVTTSCRKKVDTNSVFNKLDLAPKVTIGDGAQNINITCEINDKATEDKWEFTLTTNMGQFQENKDVKLVKKPTFKNGK
jgi:hypothetical protein